MLLEVKNLTIKLKKTGKIIVKNSNFSLEENSSLGILGESGSGKSMTCKAILNILDERFEISGEVLLNGKDILKLSKEECRKIRATEISMILQNPMTSFNPLYTIENQMLETFMEHLNFSKEEALKLAYEALEKMRLKDIQGILKKYPYELSGGMLQRIMIAIAIAMKPKLIIADEPTTAIDTLNQKDIIEEFKILKKDLDISLLFVTHDLGILSELADKLIVMQNGEIVEQGSVENIIAQPQHKHTQFLINTRRELMEQFKKVRV